MTAFDVLIIAAASILSTLVSEAISWVFVYRKDSFQKNKLKLQAAKDKLDEARRTHPGKVAKLKEELKTLRSTVGASSNLFSMGAIAVTMYLIYNFMGRLYSGVAVAKLPFVPLPLMQGFTHFNLVRVSVPVTSVLLFSLFVC